MKMKVSRKDGMKRRDELLEWSGQHQWRRGRQARLLARRCSNGTQRPVLVRFGQEVQEVPRPVTWKSRLRDLAFVALAFVIGGAALTAYTVYRIGNVGQRDDRRHVDAIVVLGAAQYNGRPSAVLAARLDHAIELYNAGFAPYFVVTGGKLPGDHYTEAETERRYAQDRNVPASAILAETTGSTTLESIRNVRALFDQHGLHTALFVSDRTHMLRVRRLAGGPVIAPEESH